MTALIGCRVAEDWERHWDRDLRAGLVALGNARERSRAVSLTRSR
jgi:hypothetical protein